MPRLSPAVAAGASPSGPSCRGRRVCTLTRIGAVGCDTPRRAKVCPAWALETPVNPHGVPLMISLLQRSEPAVLADLLADRDTDGLIALARPATLASLADELARP